MVDTPVAFVETAIAAAVKEMGLVTATLFGVTYSGITAVTGDSNTIAIGTTLGVSVTFAGLILRMVIKNQSAIWDIVRSKDKQLREKSGEIRQIKLEKEYAEWEREQARFRANERTDPGPFKASPSLLQVEEKDTTNSEHS